MRTLIALLIVVSQLAWAEEATKKKKVEYRKTQEVSFDGSDVDGEVRNPDGAFVNPQKGVRFMPIYKVDKRFDRAIKESPEYVR